MKLTWLIVIFALSAANVFAETLVVGATADAGLHEIAPDNNLGRTSHVPAGRTGNFGHGSRTRGLFKFDLAGQLPANATITSARVRLAVTFIPPGGGVASYSLHRLLNDWNEGSKFGNQGALASPGECTWNKRTTESWAEPGGKAGADYVTSPSASLDIGTIATHEFTSTALLDDVRIFAANPGQNFGWLLKADDESIPSTAKRFGGREDPPNRAQLIIEYSLGAEPIQITSVTRQGDQLRVEWTGGNPNFQLQRSESLPPTDWQAAAPVQAERVTLVPLIASAGFFRVQGNLEPVVVDLMANFEVAFNMAWSADTHPQDFPSPGAHWSALVGGTHNSAVTFWKAGETASLGIEQMAEFGGTSQLVSEINAAKTGGNAHQAFTGPSIGSGTGQAKLTFTAHRDFPLLTITSMIAPSPDWFVGVAGLPLIEQGEWIDNRTVTLFLHDAGTDSGASYRSADIDTQPREPIKQIDGFPARVNDQVVPFGTLTVTRLP